MICCCRDTLRSGHTMVLLRFILTRAAWHWDHLHQSSDLCCAPLAAVSCAKADVPILSFARCPREEAAETNEENWHTQDYLQQCNLCRAGEIWIASDFLTHVQSLGNCQHINFVKQSRLHWKSVRIWLSVKVPTNQPVKGSSSHIVLCFGGRNIKLKFDLSIEFQPM